MALAPLGSDDNFSGFSDLRELNIEQCWRLVGLATDGLDSVKTLRLKDCERLESVELEKLSALEHLEVGGSSRLLHSFQEFEEQEVGLTTVQSLDHSHCEERRVHSLPGFPAVRKVSFAWCRKLLSVGFEQGNLPMVEKLDLSQCCKLEDISALAHLVSLRTLLLSGCFRLEDISALAHLESLRTLALDGCNAVSNLDPLAPLTGLTSLRVGGTSGGACRYSQLVNVGALGALVNLRSLTLDCSGCRGQLNAHINNILTVLLDLKLADPTLEPVVGSALVSLRLLQQQESEVQQHLMTYQIDHVLTKLTKLEELD